MSASASSKEQRKSPRYRMSVPVEAKAGGPFAETLTVDLSQEGVGFISRTPLPLNETVFVELQLDPMEEPVIVAGRVQWVQPLTYGKTPLFRIGMRFDQTLGRSRKNNLKRYFKKLERKHT